ncbi:NHLP family bacteriocin export ABC transporter peptidase/permease/ATPase [Ktedonobacteria bacterium brp13]|nr:NHLP family bacteriocin export ABC transporter peptidase/permease/ATPase [Ktedonobacteria bacterium brp13]
MQHLPRQQADFRGQGEHGPGEDRDLNQQEQPQYKLSLIARLKAQIPHLPRKRVPIIVQMSAVECGAACLAMILSYYGRRTSVSEIRNRYSVGRDGLSARSIVQASRNYGLRVRAVSLRDNDFRFIQLPAIVHWSFNHFIVVERWTPDFVDVVDPQSGRKRLSGKEFNDNFTGVVIILEPGSEFSVRSIARTFTLRTYARQYFNRVPSIIIQLIVASLILQGFGLIPPILTAVLVDKVIPLHLNGVLPILLLGIVVVTIAETLVSLLRSLLSVYLQNRIDTFMLPNFFEHLLHLPLPFFQQRSSGDMLTRISSNMTLRSIIGTQFISSFLDGGLVIVYLVILYWASLQFGVLVTIIGIIDVFLLIISTKTMLRLSRESLEAGGRTQGYVTEMLTSMETVKSAGFEQQAFQQWANFFFAELNIGNRLSIYSSIMSSIRGILDIIAPLLLLWIGVVQVLDGRLALGSMLALNTLAATFLSPLSSLVSSAMQLQLVNSHVERIADVLEAKIEQEPEDVDQPPVLTGHIKLDHVNFRYNSQLPEVLIDISLEIQPGQRIAVVGQTGSGKTTLGKLLLGLYPPTQGTLYYNNIPLQSMNLQAVRNQVGVVTQEASIFSGSIRQNITFAHPELEMKGVIHASKLACLHSDIEQMPMRYETFVAEGGNAISGGQRQRLALARALAYNPRILLLDEATSSLDVMTEHQIQQNLASLSCTQIIIAHRLSTIRHADVILVMDQGHIVEQGSHEELLSQNGIYAELIRNQLVEEGEINIGLG